MYMTRVFTVDMTSRLATARRLARSARAADFWNEINAMTARQSRSDRVRSCNFVDRQITTETRCRLHARALHRAKASRERNVFIVGRGIERREDRRFDRI